MDSKLSDLDSYKKKKNQQLEIVEYIDLEDMVFRMELTYHDIEEVLDTK